MGLGSAKDTTSGAADVITVEEWKAATGRVDNSSVLLFNSYCKQVKSFLGCDSLRVHIGVYGQWFNVTHVS